MPPWHERISSWLERVLAYALAISPPLALLSALILTVRRRGRFGRLLSERWTLGVFIVLLALGTASGLLAASRRMAVQGPAGMGLLFLLWLTGWMAVDRPQRFWVDLQRATAIVAALALVEVSTQAVLNIAIGSVTLPIISPRDPVSVFGLGKDGLGPLLVYGGILALGRVFQDSSRMSRAEGLVISALTIGSALAIGVRNALWGSVAGAVALVPATGLLAPAGVLAITAVSAWLWPNTWSRFLALLRPDSEISRLVTWQIAWGMIRTHPWVGIGPFNFMLVKDRYVPAGATDYGIGPHNIYLHMASEWGLPAALLLFAWLFSWPIRLWRHRDEVWRWSLVAGLVSFLAMGLFDDPIFTLHISGPVFLGLGLASSPMNAPHAHAG